MIFRFAAPALALVGFWAAQAGAAAPQRAPCPSEEQSIADGERMLQLASATPEAFEADRRAALAALAARQEAKSRIFAAAPRQGPMGTVSHYADQARKATDPRQRELFRRVAEDQFGRMSFDTLRSGEDWAKGLSANAAKYVRHVIAAHGCRDDAANTAWLKADLKANGWYRISTAGAAADSAAWLLVQHADQDPAFQAEVLAMLEELLAIKETNPRSHAYLYDRVAVAAGRPQRFATQGRCTGPGSWEPRPIEEAETVDQRRAALGLPTLADYKADISRACG